MWRRRVRWLRVTNYYWERLDSSGLEGRLCNEVYTFAVEHVVLANLLAYVIMRWAAVYLAG